MEPVSSPQEQQGPIENLMTASAQQPEVTKLSPIEEVFFQLWAHKSGIKDLDNGKYDYRGFYKENGPVDYQWGVDHLPDTYKQHGHPTFSTESKYSKGPHDGGTWVGPPPAPGQPDMRKFMEQPKPTKPKEEKLPPGVEQAIGRVSAQDPAQADLVKTMISRQMPPKAKSEDERMSEQQSRPNQTPMQGMGGDMMGQMLGGNGSY